MKNYQFLHRKYVVPSYANRGLTIIRGDGAYLYDDKGNKYLDLMSNYGASIFGYNYPRINQAITDQLKVLSNLHGSFVSDMRAEASENLVKRCKMEGGSVYWSSSGSEAVEAALKFAVLATGKKKFIAAHRSFHGKTLGALSATGIRKYRKLLEPLLWDFEFVNYNDIAQLKNVVDKKTAGIILEPIQGESGIIVADKNYLGEAQKICKTFGSLLILDEVQTGVGRTGMFLASHENKVEADIVCLGKGLAGGLPVGATIVTAKIAENIPKFSHSSTIGGNPLICAVTLAVLENLDKKTLKTIKSNGRYLMNQLKDINSDLVVQVRGKGLMIGIQVQKDRDKILKDLQKNGILAIPAWDDVVRFLPPYIVNKKQIDNAVGILEKVLNF